MKYTEGTQGRVFVLRLFQDEVLHEVVEAFAAEKNIRSASVIAVGGADAGTTLVTGPVDGDERPVTPMKTAITDVREIAAAGTIFCDEEGHPILHMHAACGRNEETTTGCVRTGLVVWQVLEVIINEICGADALRLPDAATGFKLLSPKS